jgi:hypothetical protein
VRVESIGSARNRKGCPSMAMTNAAAKPHAVATPQVALLPGEHVITCSHDRILTLTNQRVQYHGGSGGNTKFTSITLDSVASCGLTTSTQPLLLILGLIIAFGGLLGMSESSEGGTFGLIVGLVFVVIFFVTQSAALLVCSTGGERIMLSATGPQRATLFALIQAIDAAKIAARGQVPR